MSKGLKFLLIGCGVVAVIGIIAVGVGGYLAKRWVSGKVESIEKDSQRKEQLSKEYPFTPPANNVITENQLKRLLAVRKGVYTIYEKYEKEIEAMKPQEKEGFSGLAAGVKMISELRDAQLKGLEEQRMSPEEYQYLVTTVYKTLVSASLQNYDTGIQKSIDELDQQLADPNVPEESKEQLRLTRQTLEQQRDAMKSNPEFGSIPPENLELFTKHQKEIEQYTMGGLELLGLF